MIWIVDVDWYRAVNYGRPCHQWLVSVSSAREGTKLRLEKVTFCKEEMERILSFEESNPHAVLGPHRVQIAGKDVISIRAFLPRASSAWVALYGKQKFQMEKLDDRGIFEAHMPPSNVLTRYKLVFADNSGFTTETEDAYSFAEPFLGEMDLHLFAEGTHRYSYNKLGAHLSNRQGVNGVEFAVWAPNAKSVSVVGNFNHWFVGEHPMTLRGSSGIWELFIPRLGVSEVYKFAIKTRFTGETVMKTDPYAFQTEIRPKTASVVVNLDDYHWGDGEWRNRPSKIEADPISIYEVHLGSWKRKGDTDHSEFHTYRELAEELIPYAKEMGFTHIELLPVMEHPLDDSWGYQVTCYFAPTSRYGSPEGLMYFIDKCHQNGIGVILDWVPAHFPKDEYALAMFDGTHLFNHADPRLGAHPDWGTLIFNYSRREVRSFLLSNAIFWLERYHADGLRIDAVASMLYLDYSRGPGEWIANKYGGKENLEVIAFLKVLSDTIRSLYPEALVIAEESTAWPGVTRPTEAGGLGFTMKWNMGWMHDTLEYFAKDPVYRKFVQGNLTFSIVYAFNEKFLLPLSHDEVVYEKRSMLEKMPGNDWQKLANLRLCYGYMFSHPGKKLLFMGSEFAQRNEWNFKRGLDWHLLQLEPHQKMQLYVKDLNHVYSTYDALHELDFSPEGFEWIDFHNSEQSVLSFLRKSTSGKVLVIVCNMTPVIRHNYRVGVPLGGYYREIINSDAKEYGGSGVGNMGGVWSESIAAHARAHSISITLPSLAIVMLEPEKDGLR